MKNKEVVERIDSVIGFINKGGMMSRGYMCGVVNGLRLARSYITGEEIFFDRNEVQKKNKNRNVDLDFELGIKDI